MKRYIMYNIEDKKGAIVWAEDMDQARKRAYECFYGAYRSFYRNDLNCGQVYKHGENWPFVNAKKNLIFKHVQFHFSGTGSSGVTTSYDCEIYKQPTEKQKNFIGSNEINYVLFYNTDTPQGNYGDKIGNK